MPSYTEYYNLIKPNKTDNYNVDVANTNNNVIDEELHKKVEKILGKGLSTNDFTNAYKNMLDNLKIPTNNNELKNGAGYLTKTQVSQLIQLSLLEINGQIEVLLRATEQNDSELLATKQFIENNMKTMETEGTSIHVSDSADYPCQLKIEGKSEQVQTETSPSPDYPSEIENVSGDLKVKAIGENIFNSSLLMQKEGYNTYDEETGIYTTKDGGGYNQSILYNISGMSADRDIKKLIDVPKAFCGKYITIKIFDFVNNNPEYMANNRLTLGFFDKNGKHINSYNTSYIEDKKDIISYFSVPTQKCYLDIRRSHNNGTVSFSKIQIVEGSYTAETMPKFEAYKEQSVTFPLGEQKLMKDGYLGDDGIHNKRIQIVLTGGNEYWSKRTGKNNSFNLTLNNKAIKGICNTYKSFTSPTEIDTKNGIYLLKTFAIIITDLRFTDVTEFKNWLAEQYGNGTPVVIEYELAEEETTPYTTEQQTAYNALQTLKTYRTITNISNNQDTNMVLTYKKDLQTQFQELEALVLESGV